MTQTRIPLGDEPGDAEPGGTVISADRLLRALADAPARPVAPETGYRTPQPTIQRAQRSRYRFTDLDLDDVTNILKRAEDGDIEKLAGLWMAMLKSDAHLRSVWDTRMGPLAAARWELSPPDVDDALAQSAARAVAGCEEALKGIHNLEGTFLALLDAVGLGFAVAEIVWKRGTLLGRPAWVPAALVPIQSQRFSFSDDYEIGLYDNGAAVGDLKAAGWEVTELSGRGRKIARLPAGKYIVHQPREINDYPTSTGLVFALARWWWAKNRATMLSLTGAESFAWPHLHGHVAQQADDLVVEELHEGLENLASDGVIVTRGETSIDFITANGEGGARVFDDLRKYLDAAISKLVLGSTLNVEIGDSGGNRAAAESQADQTITPRQDRDAAQVWQTIRRDLLTYIVRFNPEVFGPRAPVPMGQTVIAEEPVEVDALAIQAGVVTVDELRESRGLTPLGGEAGDRFVSVQQAAPAAFTASDDTPPEVAPRDPFAASRRPWEEAEALARALTSRGASETSGR